MDVSPVKEFVVQEKRGLWLKYVIYMTDWVSFEADSLGVLICIISLSRER